MRRRLLASTGVVLLAIIVLLAGCGSDDEGGFPNCGNGVLDGGEECDDGNIVDQDSCLSTCVFNVCGDLYLNLGVEQCEQGLVDNHCLGGARDRELCVENSDCTACQGGVNGGAACVVDSECPGSKCVPGTCQPTDCKFVVGRSGTLACTSACTYDTAGCTGAAPSPTPATTATPASATPTVAGTLPSGAPSPTPGPTPIDGACQDGDKVVVVESLDKSYGGAIIELAYPTSLNLPGTGTTQSVVDRVAFTVAGLTTVNDTDEDADGTDDTLTTSVVTFADHDPGTFATITFDCVAGEPRPAASDLTCTVVSASTGGGVAIPDAHCSLAVQ